jgi:hypothetical protein
MDIPFLFHDEELGLGSTNGFLSSGKEKANKKGILKRGDGGSRGKMGKEPNTFKLSLLFCSNHFRDAAKILPTKLVSSSLRNIGFQQPHQQCN